jgi:uncharacterized protein (DUF2147 family)
MKKILWLVPFVFLFTISYALGATPVGQWKTIDDETKQEKSIVEIYESGGMLFGKIVRLLQEKDGGVNKLCEKCTGADHNKPIVGMVIIKNMKKEGDEYKGGTIMDPAKGKTYKCILKVSADGSKLEVRGYLGIPTLGKTQVWERVK